MKTGLFRWRGLPAISRPATTEEIEVILHNMVQTNPQISTRRLAQQFSTCRSSVRRILHRVKKTFDRLRFIGLHRSLRSRTEPRCLRDNRVSYNIRALRLVRLFTFVNLFYFYFFVGLTHILPWNTAFIWLAEYRVYASDWQVTACSCPNLWTCHGSLERLKFSPLVCRLTAVVTEPLSFALVIWIMLAREKASFYAFLLGC